MSLQDLPIRDMPEPLCVAPEVRVGAAAPTVFTTTIRAAVDQLATAVNVAHRLSTHDLADTTRDVLAVLQLAESAAVTLAGEAATRGIVTESTAANLAQWVARLGAGEPVASLLPPAQAARSGPLMPCDEPDAAAADAGNPADACRDDATELDPSEHGAAARPQVPGLEPVHAYRIAKVATACVQPKNVLVHQALQAGEVSTTCANLALKHAEKVMPLLPTASRDDVLGYYLALRPDVGVRAIRELTNRLTATYATEESLEDSESKLEAVESVSWSNLENGMVRLVADLTAAHAAQVKAAVGALSAPVPYNDCCDDPHHRHTGEQTGEPDARSAAKRRADALMLLARHGTTAVSDDGSIMTRGSVQLVVTMDLDVLRGVLAGYGLTHEGEALTATQIRMMACDAEVVPMVLGSDGVPLDVGRTRRLATPAIRRAVVQRDRCCTFPGCGRPPSWCQVHHIVPWHLGGKTSVENSALLCQRHHTVVHRDPLTARLVDGHLVWDSVPGRTARSPGYAA